MDLIEEAYRRLFPEKEFKYVSELNYNLRLADFNANVRFNRERITFNLNLQWKDIDDEIKIGLIQSLLLKIFKTKKNTTNLELYHNFIRNIPMLTPKLRTDPLLESSFQRVNAKFFEGKVEPTNLGWGSDSRRKLASYNFHEDEISVSTLFKSAAPEVLDYVMYHEMLHKWQKYTNKNGRNSFHGREFREAERQYPQQQQVEQEIKKLIRQKSLAKSWWKVW